MKELISDSEYARLAARTRQYIHGLSISNAARRLLEAGICLPGECAELVVVITGFHSRDGIIDELGDCDWYRQELDEVLAKDYNLGPGYTSQYFMENPALENRYEAPYGLTTCIKYLHIQAGLIANVIKKHIMYGRELDREAISKACGYYDYYRAEIGKLMEFIYEVTIHDIRRHNLMKLSKRYNLED